MALSGIQAFAPEAARMLHEVPAALAAMCLTIYMVCERRRHGRSAVSWSADPRVANASSASASASPPHSRW